MNLGRRFSLCFLVAYGQFINLCWCKRGGGTGIRVGAIGAARASATGAFGSIARPGASRAGGTAFVPASMSRGLTFNRMAMPRGQLLSSNGRSIARASTLNTGLQSPHSSGSRVVGSENVFHHNTQWKNNANLGSASRYLKSGGQTSNLNNGKLSKSFRSKLPMFFGGALAGYMGGKAISTISKSVSRFYHPTYQRFYWFGSPSNVPSKYNHSQRCTYVLNGQDPDEVLNYDNQTRIEKIIFECRREEECCDLDCCPKRYSAAQIMNKPNYNALSKTETRVYQHTSNKGQKTFNGFWVIYFVQIIYLTFAFFT